MSSLPLGLREWIQEKLSCGENQSPSPSVHTGVWDASDEALLAGFATGDPDAAAVFVRRFQDRLFGLALMLTRNRRDADEVAQDALVRAWRYAHSYDARRGSVLGWLLTIVRNVALDRIRIIGRRRDWGLPEFEPSALIDDSDIADAAARRDSVGHVLSAMRALPAEQRDALLAVTIHGLSAREYSDRAELPLGTVKTRIRLARARCVTTSGQLHHDDQLSHLRRPCG
jgi:RNA polymerase sigma-70 factor (ECF subfamily)